MSDCSYTPLFGRVLIEREIVRKTAGGLIIPDKEQKRLSVSKGKVIALGETAGWSKTFDDDGNEKSVRVINVGDEVIFGRHASA